jgi:DivIVA domain-containing protein
MDLTPNDVRHYEFSSQMRGFDREQVASFREEVARALELLKQENLKLTMEKEQLQSQVESLKQFEDAIKGAAIDARRNADKLVQEAKAEASRLLERAKQAAEEIVQARSQQVQDLREQIMQLDQIRQSYLEKLTSLLKSHMGEIKSVEAIQTPELPEKLEMPDVSQMIDLNELPDLTPEAEVPEDAIEVTDSSEMRRSRRETIATLPSRKEQSIRTEEANAPSKIVAKPVEEMPAVDEEPPVEDKQPIEDEPSDNDLTESLRKMVQDEERRQEKAAQAQTPPQVQTPLPEIQTPPPQAQAPTPPEPPTDEQAQSPLPDAAPETADKDQPQGATASKSAEEGLMDPDLAAALESYTHHNQDKQTPTPAEPNPVAESEVLPPIPTDAQKPRDIPDGFIAAGQEDLSADATDPVRISKAEEGQQKPRPTDVMDPDAFARELDSIADRFEEEISKVDRK